MALCAALLVGAVHAATPIEPFTAHYQLSRNDLRIGESRISLETGDDGAYVYRSDTQPRGLLAWLRNDRIQERSEGVLEERGVRPTHYRYEHTGGSRERLAVLSFDWEDGVVENRVENKPWEMPVPDDAVDKLVVTLAVMLDLERGRSDMAYAVADGGHLKHWRFRVIGRERVTTSAGEFDTVKLERVREDDKRTTHIWVAPELRHLPVRIEQYERGEGAVYRSDLREYNKN